MSRMVITYIQIIQLQTLRRKEKLELKIRIVNKSTIKLIIVILSQVTLY